MTVPVIYEIAKMDDGGETGMRERSYSIMKISTACKIFLQVNSDKYTDEEKGMAIYEVLKMPTHNGITKDAMLKVIEYLLNLAFDIPEENEAEQND